jgi:hypothetical protein
MTADALNAETDAIVEQIKPLLAGRHPAVQGIVLCDLLAIWLAGHQPEAVEPLIDAHIRGVRQLIPLYRERNATPQSEN